ncbi:MAG: 50S ribosomal protein L4 [Candidatus Kaiserbacteria bacterium]|nr:50S ribosomal protein L4 [Candidatus Kaiserbacteria bacterium]
MATKTTKEKKVKISKDGEAVSPMLKSDIYDVQGKKAGAIELPENIFGLAWNDALMHQVVTTMQANARPLIAHVKNRGEVRGGGRKPWQQKGTGRARHGSIRSPIWRGGGVTHGPRNDKVYAREIPKKMRAKALFIALSRKFRDGELLFVNSFGIETPKTAVAKKAMVMLSKVSGFNQLASKRKNAVLIGFADMSPASEKSFRNIGNVECASIRNINPVSVLHSKYMIIENPEASVAIIQNRASKKQ